MKNISFLSGNSQFLEVKFSIYLNRRVLKREYIYFLQIIKLIVLLFKNDQGPVVQSIVSFTGPLVTKPLTVVVSTISHSQVIFAEKKTYMPYLMIKVLLIR